MPRFSVRRKVAALLLGTLLVAPWASASEPQGRPQLRVRQLLNIEDVFDHLRQIFFGIWIKNGGSLDPNGNSSQTTSSGSSATSDNGSSADPDG